jgi:hypothetical protein
MEQVRSCDNSGDAELHEGVTGGREERTHLVQGAGDGVSTVEAVEREVAVMTSSVF